MAMTGVLRPGHAQISVLDLEEGINHYGKVLGLIETPKKLPRSINEAVLGPDAAAAKH